MSNVKMRPLLFEVGYVATAISLETQNDKIVGIFAQGNPDKLRWFDAAQD